jgi:translation initiation factor eIF-2B subunit delta
MILSRIDHFVRDRITYATRVIAHNLATGKIRNGDVILTFARSSVVQQAILEAWERGKKFSVIIVDARPLCEGELACKSFLTMLANSFPSFSLSSTRSQAAVLPGCQGYTMLLWTLDCA